MYSHLLANGMDRFKERSRSFSKTSEHNIKPSS